jgi:hypothetical protein
MDEGPMVATLGVAFDLPFSGANTSMPIVIL